MMDENECYIMLHFENYRDKFYAPLKGTNRIKYTSFNVSKKFIVYGATSGGLYIFSRDTNEFLQLIPTTEGSISHVIISDNEKFIAFSTKKNVIAVVELVEFTLGKQILRSEELTEYLITTLQWSADNNSLFIGTSAGKLAILRFPFMNKTNFHLPTYTIVNLDSTVVQIDRFNELLLVSTLTRCYLCDTIRNCYKQIGEKLRNGEYGACFLPLSNNLVKIYSARPGSRLWEVDSNCTVHSTQEYKQNLAVPPTSFVSLYETPPRMITPVGGDRKWPKQSFNFAKIYGMLEKYVLTYKKDGIYLLNVDSVTVLFWTDYFTDVVDVKRFNNTIYIWTLLGNLHKLQLLPLAKCLLKLYFMEFYRSCLEVIEINREIILNCPSHELTQLQPILLDIDTKVPDIDDRSKYTLSVLNEKINSLERVNLISSIETRTGVHLVHNKHLSKQLMDKRVSIISDDTGSGRTRKTANEKIDNHLNYSSSSLSDSESIAASKSIGSKQCTAERHDIDTNDSFYKDFTSDELYAEMGVYNVPFVSLASYNIIQEALAEFGTNVTEFWNSKNIKDKLDSLETRLNPFSRGKQTGQLEPPLNVGRPEHSEEAEMMVHDATENDDEIAPVVVTPRPKPSFVYECNASRINAICSEIESYENETAATSVNYSIEHRYELWKSLMNEIVSEFVGYCSFNEQRPYETDAYFPLRNYFNDNNIDTIRSTFQGMLDTKGMRDYVRRDCEFFRVVDESSVSEYYPLILNQVYGLEDLKFDFALRKLLQIFSKILDPFSIVQKVRSLNVPCYYGSLMYILDYFKTSSDDVLENNSNDKRNDWPLPIYLNAMLMMSSLGQEQVFCQMGIKRNAHLCDISYLTLTMVRDDSGSPRYDSKTENDSIWPLSEPMTQQWQEKQSSSEQRNRRGSLFLEYLLRHLTLNPSDIYTIFGNRGLLCHTMYEFCVSVVLNRKRSLDLCQCWLPLSSVSDVGVTKYEKIGHTLILYFWSVCEKVHNRKSLTKIVDDKFLNALEQLVFPENVAEGESQSCRCYVGVESCSHKLCETVFAQYDNTTVDDTPRNEEQILASSLRLLCSVCRKYPTMWSYVRTLQTRNSFRVFSLEHYVQFGFVTELQKAMCDLETAERAIELNSRIQEGYCTNCNSNSGAKLALRWDDLLISILGNFGVHETTKILRKKSLPQSAFSKRFYQNCILLQTVENYGDDIKKKVIAAASDLYNLSAVNESIGKEIKQAFVEDKKQIVNLKQKSSRHHWGASVDMSKAICLCCSLPLFSQHLLQEENGGIVAFSCQHFYHTVCLKHKNSQFSCMFCNNTYHV